MIKKFNKILIANRGEIAVRIIRAAKSLGIKTVALYTDGEESAPHVTQADEAVFLGDGDLNDTYLNIDKIVDLAKQTGAQAIHPGYGFLSENPEFAKSCYESGIVFIGPSINVLEQMGNKVLAKSLAKSAGVNVLDSHKIDLLQIEKQASHFSYPVLIKASHGGGGKGMQLVYNFDELIEKAKLASRSAQNYFGNGEVFLESFIENARHIEVQILADMHGNIVHLYERDCTVQRNHQKIIEEAPAACLSSDLRSRILDAAISICKKVAFENAGTVEFLVDQNKQFYFLEMNPRIQVEHPVTEQVTGIDIVKEQLLLAAGNPLSFSQDEVKVTGHAIEVRIYAENPSIGFTPSGHPIRYVSFPHNEVIRVETGINAALNGADQFDPLLCKLIATGVDREHAISRLQKALDETVIVGPQTNQLYLNELIKTTAYEQNNLTTRFCEQHHKRIVDQIKFSKEKFDSRFLIAASLFSLYNLIPKSSESVWNSIGYWRMYPSVDINIDDVPFKVLFERKQKGIFIKYKDESFFAEMLVNQKTKKVIKLQIENEVKEFSIFKENDAKIQVVHRGITFEVSANDKLDYYPENEVDESELNDEDQHMVKSHLYGKIVTINIEKNQTVNKGDVLLVIESMKSEIKVISPKKTKIKKISVAVGAQVTDQMPLVYLEDL